MSEEYRHEWCSYCETITGHEDGFCMECGKPYWASVEEWEKEVDDDKE